MPRPPGAIVKALFLDVPYILDSIWRWADFESNRLLRLGAGTPPAYKARSLMTTPLGALFLVTSTALVFGPTSDTFCSAFGTAFAKHFRHAMGLALLVLTAIAAWRLMSAYLTRFARRAIHVLVNGDGDTAGAGARSLGAFLHLRTYSELIRSLLQIFESQGDAAAKLFRRERARFLITAATIIVAAIALSIPFLVIGSDLVGDKPDETVCYFDGRAAYGLAEIAILLLIVTAGIWALRLNVRPAMPRILASRRYRAMASFLLITAAWVAAVGLLWKLGADVKEADGGPYRMVIWVPLALLAIIILASSYFARVLFLGSDRVVGNDLRTQLGRVELLGESRSESDPTIDRARVVAAIFNGAFYNFPVLLLLPSLVALVVSRDLLYGVTFAYFVLTLFLLTFGSLSTRWDQLVLQIRRWYLHGTPLIVSCIVIVLALLRLSGNQYVSTILDSASFSAMVVHIVTAYSAFWFFEYWINRWIAEECMALISKDGTVASTVEYPYAPPAGTIPRVSRDGRTISIHGTGRICAQGYIEDVESSTGQIRRSSAFNIFTIEEFITVLTGNDFADHARDIRRRIKCYFAVTNLLLIIGFVALFTWQGIVSRPLRQASVVEADGLREPAGNEGNLASKLVVPEGETNPSPAIIVAASGGGTRAALYTTYALEGLARLDRAKDIVLISGVSGGALSASYFVSHFATLSDPASVVKVDDKETPWDEMRDVVTRPYIQDVIEGTAELRIAGSTSLGTLLAESLQKRAFTGELQTFGDLKGPALILNTTVTGHPARSSDILFGRIAGTDEDDKCRQQERPFALLAGGRLIFTNLTTTTGFPTYAPGDLDIRLNYYVVRDPAVELSRATALSANFPPVFSNARVRLIDKRLKCPYYSYYVTDGGATENLGLLSALYALRGALEEIRNNHHGARLRPIVVVSVEASAVTYDYSQDRGVGAATGGAKERVTAGLTVELAQSLNASLENMGQHRMRMHYLPLPLAFRSRGGFGTHWMYARKIDVVNPHLTTPPQWYDKLWHRLQRRQIVHDVELSQGELETLWTALFEVDADICDSSTRGRLATTQQKQVALWICGIDDSSRPPALVDVQVKTWRTMARELHKDNRAISESAPSSSEQADNALN